MAVSDPNLVQRILATHETYDREKLQHRFLLDAHAGTGGFLGRVGQALSSYWGPAADMYSLANTALLSAISGETETDPTTYLDRYPREDDSKFLRRKQLAHYDNYIEVIVDTRVSYFVRKDPTREDVGPKTEEWMNDVDGRGTTWDALIDRVIAPRAAVLGWTPVLFDMAERDPADLTEADVLAKGGPRLRAIPLFPGNLLSWAADEYGHMLWAKVRIDTVDQPDALSPSVRMARVTVWTRETATIYTLRGTSDSAEPNELVDVRTVPHPFGKVPVVLFKHHEIVDDCVRGRPMAAAASVANRRLFNLVSELDEHMRSQVFALLQVPTDDPSKLGGLKVGTSNALPIPMNSTRDYMYVAPPATCAATYETRIENTVMAIYRMGRIEYTKGTIAGAESGVSRAYAFEGTNRAIADFAAAMASAETEALRLVGVALGDTTPEDARVTPAQRFDIEELSTELKSAADAISLKLGARATTLIKKRALGLVLPNLSNDDMQEIESELEEVAAAEDQEAAMMREASAAALDEPPSDEDEKQEEQPPMVPKRPGTKGPFPPKASKKAPPKPRKA